VDDDGEQKPKSHAADRGGHTVDPPDFPRFGIEPTGNAVARIKQSHADRRECQRNDDPTHQPGHRFAAELLRNCGRMMK
jgi:hypothetical protein